MRLTLIPPAYADETLESVECYGAFCPEANAIEPASVTIEKLLTMVVGFLTIVAGLAFLIYFIIGGLGWVTAGGDKGKVEKAQSMMTNGVIGMIVVVAAYGITWIVGQVLGIDILNPAELLGNLT
ncbi:hypothetical protein A2W24_00435 [Microgenomates group bacterium RBG_16_45_19]|nr:MAG: hypothetical protein A2W24_00435 [Microgenomates group bacterium RBG_16_45_19]